LRELPSFWHLPVLSAERMAALARQLGADVPFCLYGVTARAGGVGDALETLPPFIGYEVLLVNPSVPLSTARVFKNLQLGTMEHPPVDAVARAILQRDPRALGRLTGNVLEAPAMAALPVIAEIKEVLRGTGAPVVLMSGSGPTVFALHDKKGWAKRMARSIARPEWTIIATKTR
jgi:4-diphosphocytidyl-2C-methyl-D-erythritol kinase